MSNAGRLAILAMLLIVNVGSQAHHSFAMFDMSKQSSIQGTVKSLEWSSPHVWLWVVVDSPKQAFQLYGLETVSPGQLVRDFGWERHSLNVGDKIKVDYFPLKSGEAGGGLIRVTLADGKVLETRFSKSLGGESHAPQQ